MCAPWRVDVGDRCDALVSHWGNIVFCCCFQTGSLRGWERSCFTLAAIPPSCVRLGPMGVFQWHRDELCTLSCGRRDGPDGGTHSPQAASTSAPPMLGRSMQSRVSDLVGLGIFKKGSPLQWRIQYAGAMHSRMFLEVIRTWDDVRTDILH